jgi:cytosine/adenosine deaminase-related metal-dependent hydrolase
MRGVIPEHAGLDNFIYNVVTGRAFKENEIRNAIIEADKEMQREGIVAVGDICNTGDSFEVKSRSRIYYHSFVEIFNMEKSRALDTYRAGTVLLEKAREEYKLKASLVPHASYSVSENLFRLFRTELNTEDNLLSIHNQETPYEDEFISSRKGNFLELFEKLGFEKGDSRPRNMNSLPWLSRVIPDRSPLVLVHNVHTTPEEIENARLDLAKTWFCLCPNSNLYISNLLPGTYLMHSYPDNVCLGTDSLSSNHRLSILEEMKTLDKHYPQIGLASLINFATLNGARMLGIDHFAGSLEPGKRPGVNLVEHLDLGGLRLRRESVVRVLI